MGFFAQNWQKGYWPIVGGAGMFSYWISGLVYYMIYSFQALGYCPDDIAR